MFRQIYDFPRVVLNNADATATDTIHRMKCRANPEQTVANTYTHLTAASAEIEGRSYGGGVLELEPTEATNLLVPAELCDAMPVDKCDEHIRRGRLADVLPPQRPRGSSRSGRSFSDGVHATQSDLGENARSAAIPPPPIVVSDSTAKGQARAQVARLVAAFKRNESDYVSAAYNETQARTDFISPLLAAFGWDVYNAKGHQLALREVIEEPSVEVGEERVNKRPDYEFETRPSAKTLRRSQETQHPHRYGSGAGLSDQALRLFWEVFQYRY